MAWKVEENSRLLATGTLGLAHQAEVVSAADGDYMHVLQHRSLFFPLLIKYTQSSVP